MTRERHDDRGETVILLHGLGSGPVQLALLAKRLRRAGYRVESPGYPSTKEPLERLVTWLDGVVEECERDGAARIHFVTHSLGGIIVRAYLAERDRPFDGRVVMLAPPNRGSEIVDAFQKSPLLTKLLGPVGSRLGTDPGSIPSSLPPANFEVGVITGNRSINPVLSRIISGPDDGRVGVDRARLDGADAFKVVPGTHTFLMNRPDVVRDVICFLEEGRFEGDG